MLSEVLCSKMCTSDRGFGGSRVRTWWASLNQQLINKATDQWRPRLKTVVKVHGEHIKQLFTWLSCCCMKFSLFYLDKYASTYFHKFVFHHCDVIQLGCFDSIVSFVSNILTCYFDILIRFWHQYVQNRLAIYMVCHFVHINKCSSILNRII